MTKVYVRLRTSSCLLIDPAASPAELHAEGRRWLNAGLGMMQGFAAAHHPDRALTCDVIDNQNGAMLLCYAGAQLMEQSEEARKAVLNAGSPNA